jgi:FkbM family methyltransferase
MIKNFIKCIYYLIYDILKIFINIYTKNNFVVVYPRFFGLLLKKIKIYHKSKKIFFDYHIRDSSDITTVYEIFSKEEYNLKKFMIFRYIEQYFQDLLKNKKIPLIIDCGSNIGASSFYFSKIFEESKIILVEPDYESYIFSKKNLLEKNFFFLNNVISNQKQTVKFTNNKQDNRSSKIDTNGNVEIESLTVNEVINKFDITSHNTFLIKIDIEGYEKNLFMNNYEWIDKFKIIIIELHDWMLPTEGNSTNFVKALSDIMVKKTKRDLILSGENLISIRIDE